MKAPVVAAVAVKVTLWPTTEGLRLDVRTVTVGSTDGGSEIVSSNGVLQLLTKFWIFGGMIADVKQALMLCAPIRRFDVLNTAAFAVAGTVPRGAVPS